jgi:hypothetical protein
MLGQYEEKSICNYVLGRIHLHMLMTCGKTPPAQSDHSSDASGRSTSRYDDSKDFLIAHMDTSELIYIPQASLFSFERYIPLPA